MVGKAVGLGLISESPGGGFETLPLTPPAENHCHGSVAFLLPERSSISRSDGACKTGTNTDSTINEVIITL